MVSESPSEDTVGELGRFYDYLWGSESGYVYLPYKVPSTEDWIKVLFEWPKHRKEIIRHTLAQTAEGNDVYCAPAIFKEPRPLRENVKGSNVLWADFDGSVPEGWSAETTEALSEAHVDGEVPLPTLRIQSSSDTHLHVYWKLDEFTTDLDFIETTNRALAYTLKADTSGWDLGQVLRPPGTTNYKHDLPVTIVEVNENQAYKTGAFGGLRPVKQLVSDALDVTDIPDASRVVAKYTFDDQHYELFFSHEIPEGHRSSALMKIGFFGAESGMSDAEIYSLLLNADDRWGKFKNRSDRKRRLLDIINRARQKHPVGISTPEGLLRAATNDAVSEAPKYVYGFEDFLNSDLEIEWALDGLLEIGGIGMLAAAPGIGKTQMSIQLAICCALERPFLSWTPTRRMKILVLSLEMSHPALKHFVATIAPEYSSTDHQILNRNLQIVPLGEPLPLDHPDGRKFLEVLLDEYKPDGVIIDSLGKLTYGSINNDDTVKDLNRYLVGFRKKYGCFFWLVHHNRKAQQDNKKPTDLSDLYGSQYIAAEASTVLMLWRDKNGDKDEVEIITAKNRLSRENDAFAVHRNEHLTFHIPAQATGLQEAAANVTNDSKPEPTSDGSKFISDFDL